ncbi:DUF1707 SHOCT-like domain-containing protein [Actinopolymorpha cephalotaxi]
MTVQPEPAHRPRRVGDEERHMCADQLAAHHAKGRLSAEEFEERLGIALTAQTAGELGRVLSDLPFPETAASHHDLHSPQWAWVGGGAVLLATSVIVIVLMSSTATFAGGEAALQAATATLAGIIATLLVLRGVFGRWPASSNERVHGEDSQA